MSKAIRPGNVQLKRAYEAPSPSDGTRVLVDRLWPRGVRKADARIETWAKELAPSADLRKWFGHDPARWHEFEHRYGAELAQHGDQLEQLRRVARKGCLTLVYAARDEEHNDAVVLRKLLLGATGPRAGRPSRIRERPMALRRRSRP